MTSEIGSGGVKEAGVALEVPETDVAVHAEKGPNSAGVMAVVDREALASARLGSPTDGTDSGLGREQDFVLLEGHSVRGKQSRGGHTFLVLRVPPLGVLSSVTGVGLVPRRLPGLGLLSVLGGPLFGVLAHPLGIGSSPLASPLRRRRSLFCRQDSARHSSPEWDFMMDQYAVRFPVGVRLREDA